MGSVPTSVAYGPSPSQHLRRTDPDRAAGGDVVGTAVLLHGGWWRARHDLDLMDPLAGDLVGRGWRVANVEYRRVAGPDGAAAPAPGDVGGWPTSLDDVLAALDRLAADGVDLGRAVLVGHSAGGQLALMAARERAVAGVVAQAPVTDLEASAREGLGEDGVAGFLGVAPDAHGSPHRAASPVARLPIGRPQLVVHAEGDARVPVAQSERYVAAARAAGDGVELLRIEGGDHFTVIDPTHPAWTASVRWMADRVAAAR